jgi:hypothetical protein
MPLPSACGIATMATSMPTTHGRKEQIDVAGLSCRDLHALLRQKCAEASNDRATPLE